MDSVFKNVIPVPPISSWVRGRMFSCSRNYFGPPRRVAAGEKGPQSQARPSSCLCVDPEDRENRGKYSKDLYCNIWSLDVAGKCPSNHPPPSLLSSRFMGGADGVVPIFPWGTASLFHQSPDWQDSGVGEQGGTCL